jgi:hypothetical protein
MPYFLHAGMQALGELGSNLPGFGDCEKIFSQQR